MRKLLVVVIVSIVFIGCNPSKEERIQRLETELEKASEKIERLETRIELLEKKII